MCVSWCVSELWEGQGRDSVPTAMLQMRLCRRLESGGYRAVFHSALGGAIPPSPAWLMSRLFLGARILAYVNVFFLWQRLKLVARSKGWDGTRCLPSLLGRAAFPSTHLAGAFLFSEAASLHHSSETLFPWVLFLNQMCFLFGKGECRGRMLM